MGFQRFVIRMSVVVAIAVSLSQPLLSTTNPAQGPSASSVASEIARIREQWASDLHDKRLDSITMLYAPDAVFLSDGSGRVTGRAAIHDLCRGAMASLTSTMHLHSVRVESAGNLAYDSGDYDETVVPMSGGVKQELKGSYLMVFKRQADGKWLIVEQVWTEKTGS